MKIQYFSTLLTTRRFVILTVIGCSFLLFCSFGLINYSNVILADTNSPPTANSDTFQVHGTSTFPPPDSGVLANDTDPDGDTLTAQYQQHKTDLGTATIFHTGLAGFVPDSDATGTVTVPYQMYDGQGGTSISTVTFNIVNADPVAVNDFYDVVGDSYSTPNEGSPRGVLINDYDAEEDYPLKIGHHNINVPGAGRIIINTNGVATYFRNPTPNFVGAATATYGIADQLGATATGQVTFLVHPKDGYENAGSTCRVPGFANAPQSVGQPVNVTNGNMWLEQSDYNLSGLGFGISVSRFYNSIVQSSGYFGFGWSTIFDTNLVEYDDQMLRINMHDRRAVYFGRANTTDNFQAVSPDVYGEIIKNTNGTYTLTFKNGSSQHFDANGKLIWQKDRNGNQTTLNYDANGILTGVTDASGRTLNITVVNGLVTQISDSLGVVATYDYFVGTTQLKEVTYQDGSKYKFEYDTTSANNRILLKTVKDSLDNVLETHQYDSSGRATTSEKDGGVEKYTLDYSNISFTTVTDALGRTTKYHFTKNKGRNFVTKTEGNCNCGSGSEVTEYEYNQKLNVTKKTDSLQRETTYTYDDQGNTLTMTDTWGTVTFTYDSLGQVLTMTDRLGGVWSNTYECKR